MTKTEVKKILKILLTADGGCSVCASELFKLFVYYFPQFEAEADKVWKEEYSYWSDFRREQ